MNALPIEKKKSVKDPSKDALDIMTASLYGLSPDFLKENDTLLDNTRRILSDKLSPSKQSVADLNSGKLSNVAEYTKILTSVMQLEEKYQMLNTIKNSEEYTNPSGSQSIFEESQVVDKLSDSTIIDEMVAGVQNHFSLMPEYSKVCQIIPELGKCIEIIVKDIINRDEFSHTFIKNFYKEDSDVPLKNNIETKIKELLDEYDFEGKIRRWLKDAETMGVKPFSILPQDDVINMINQEIKRRKGVGLTSESLCVEDIFSEEDYLVTSPLSKNYEIYDKIKFGLTNVSIESDEYKQILKSVESDMQPFVNTILTTDIVQQWSEICEENLTDIFNTEKLNHIETEKEYKEYCTSFENFKQSLHDPINTYTKESLIKAQLQDLVMCIDRNIEVINPRKTPLYQASKKLKNNDYSNEQSNIDKGIIDNFYRIADGNEVKDSIKPTKTFNLDGFDIDISDDPIDPEKYAKSVKNRRAILTEYEPEHVIPLSSGGTHIGYYIVEYVRTSGDNFLLLKKDRGSFLDIIRRLGVGEDKALVANSGTTAVDSNNPFSSGAFSPSTIMAPILSGGGFGPMSPSGRQFGNNGQSDRKAELIKTIMIKTIAKRLGDDTLIDNGTFQSSLMNLIRDDVIFRNRIRFTFIPESHMVYMNRELDSAGFPLSVLDGTLFNCYTYISSIISSLMMKVMKSSDTEVMEVNVGKSKELGLTIGTISQNASTRNVSAKTLFGGTDNIVRSVGNYKRIIIPVINGQKLYDVTQVAHTNDLDIDDDFTSRNLKSIIMKIGVPPTSLDMLSQDEYVASMTQHRIDYRNLIVDRGVNYAKFITKAIKLLVHYSDISIPVINLNNKSGDNKDDKTPPIIENEDKNKNEIKIDISKIAFSFAVPKNLTVNKISEEIASVSTLVDDIIKMYYGDITREGEEWQTLIAVTRKKLMRELSSSTDWSVIDDIIANAKRDTPAIHAELSKYNVQVVSGNEDSSNKDENTDGENLEDGDTSSNSGTEF